MSFFKSRRSSSKGSTAKASTGSAAKANTGQSKPQASSNEGFEIGARVLIGGLNGAIELNGQVAVVFGYDASAGRYIVELENGCPGVQKRVRAENLVSKGNSTGAVAARARMAAAAASGAKAAPPSSAKSFASAPPRPPSVGHTASRNSGAQSTPPQPQQSDSMKFRPGMKVTISGLSKAPELNGKSGTIQRFDAAAGRYVVKVDGSGSEKSLRPDNLTAMTAQKAERAERDQKFDAIDADLHDQLEMGEEAKGAMTRLKLIPDKPGLVGER